MKSIDLVREFHARFGQPDADAPMLDSEQVNELRLKLLREETDELAEAPAARDPVAVLDALTDLQYVLDGSYLQLGFATYKDAATAEVHRSNMSKLGEDGKPVLREDGKITKGPRYEPPDLAGVLHSVARDRLTVKPCPFCGDLPTYMQRASDHTPTKEFHVLTCHCGGYSARAWQSGETREAVILAWNRRAP